MFSSELGLEYVLFAILIFLTLLAAVGAWFRPRGLSRSDAEDLFSQSYERTCGETQRLQELLQESGRQNAAEMTAIKVELSQKTDDLLARVNAALVEVQGVISNAASQQQENIQRNLGDLTSNVQSALQEARQSQDAGIEKVETSLKQVEDRVGRASSEMRESILELARQQSETKAQSAIQLCEALINSLGTLRNTIAAQIADQRPHEFLPGDESSVVGSAATVGEAPVTAAEEAPGIDPDEEFKSS